MTCEQLLDTIKTNIYRDSLALISYNSTFTDSVFVNMRKKLYEPFAEPQFVVDGSKITTDSIMSIYTSSIDAARSYLPSFNITLDAQGSATDGSITLKIVNVDSSLALDSVFAVVSVCQDSVEGILKHGFNYVCRDLFSFPISVPYADSTDTTLSFTHSYPIEKLHAVAFIQNLKQSSTQYLKVYQAATVQFQAP
jgi:hypothetical protein